MTIQTTTFKGARYIVKFHNPIQWSDEESYEAIEAVQYNAYTYISKQPVPAGVQIDNEAFWLLWADPNAQMEQLRQLVSQYQEQVETLSGNVESLSGDVENFAAIIPASAFSAENTVKKYIDFDISKAHVFDTVADMKSADTLSDGAVCHTNGFYAANDGGAAWYMISDTGTANEMDVIACGELFAHIIMTGQSMTPEMIGAIESGKANIAKFERLFEIASEIKFASDFDFDFIPDSTVLSPTRILISDKEHIHIDGNGHTVSMKGLTKTYLESIDDTSSSGRDVFSFLAFHDCSDVIVENINFVGTNLPDAVNAFRYQSPRSICVAFKHCSNCTVKNISGTNILGNVVNATTDDTLTYGCSKIIIADCKAVNCYENGFNFMGGSSDCIMHDCYSKRCGTGAEAYGAGCVIKNCIAANCFSSGFNISGSAIIKDCKAKDSQGNSDSSGHGICITGNATDISQYCKILGCIIENCSGYGLYVYPYTEHTIVKGNVVRNTGVENTYNVANMITGTSAHKTSDIRIQDNIFELAHLEQTWSNIGNVQNMIMDHNVFTHENIGTKTFILSIASTTSDYRITNNDSPVQFNKGTSTNYVIGNNVIGKTIPAIETDL